MWMESIWRVGTESSEVSETRGLDAGNFQPEIGSLEHCEGTHCEEPPGAARREIATVYYLNDRPLCGLPLCDAPRAAAAFSAFSARSLSLRIVF